MTDLDLLLRELDILSQQDHVVQDVFSLALRLARIARKQDREIAELVEGERSARYELAKILLEFQQQSEAFSEQESRLAEKEAEIRSLSDSLREAEAKIELCDALFDSRDAEINSLRQALNNIAASSRQR